jgi:hypothetical protein
VIQGTFSVIQGTFRMIQGTFGVIQRTFGVIQIMSWRVPSRPRTGASSGSARTPFGRGSVIQGTFSVIQGTFDVIQGTFDVIRGTFDVIQGTSVGFGGLYRCHKVALRAELPGRLLEEDL